jgi:nucleoside-diphosphate-sugar epimerase
MVNEALDASWRGCRVAVTGGAGFIGSTLAVALAKVGASVSILDSFDDRGGANKANLADHEDNIRIIKGDIRDVRSVCEVVEGADFLFNLAGQTSHQDSMSEPLADLDINSRAQLVILEACKTHAPDISIVYASTRQLYGRPQYLPVDERHPIDPPDINAINKIAGEHYHILYHRVYGLKTSIARLTNVYGPRMRIKDARQMFLGSWIGAALSGRTFEVWGGQQRRDLSFVDDTVAALIAISGTKPGGRIFNIGGSAPVTLQELADMVIEAVGGGCYAVRAMPEQRRLIDIGDFFADDRLLREATGWCSTTSLEAGLKRTVEFYRSRLALYS